MRYLSRRLAHGLLVLAGVSVLSFVFTALAPGDYAALARQNRVLRQLQTPHAVAMALEKEMGFKPGVRLGRGMGFV